eukprot:31361-Pelagococcus_subviridis.AAC.7
MLIPFATSVQYGDDREYFGSVVNATWLFTTTCNVPPIVYSGSCDMSNVSYTIPCPEKAPSPCRRTAMCFPRSTSFS